MTGLPDPPGEHTLDVYAEDEDGVWSHARFVFTTSNPDWTTPTTTTTSETTPTSTSPTGASIDPLQLTGIAGVASIIIVVLIIVILKRRGS